LGRADRSDDYEFSYEGHPNHTTVEQLQALYDMGFRRNSFGIQDYDPVVQKAINRIQSFEQVKRVNDLSRSIGYRSVSHDLIFGLPFQTETSIRNTIDKTIELRPDRIAYYSYAHVPWIKGVGQRGFDENDLPKESEKRYLYELGKQMLFDNGYIEIGMDHFALPTDSLYEALVSKKLHRNFMGYTAGKTQLMIGLGMSSISDSWYAFAQNEKSIEEYTTRVDQGELPIFRGHLLSNTDLVIRKHILDIMCNLETHWNDGLTNDAKNEIKERLRELVEDGILEVTEDKITVKEKGRMFVRNICMAFDLRLIENTPNTRIFSMTI
jgi:oxygen-independent coproporphyrinogen-3 oxidase